MTIGEHTEEFASYSILDWESGSDIDDPENTLIRISLGYDEAEDAARWSDKFAEFLELPEAELVPGIVVGAWEDVGTDANAERVVQALVAARENLRALHVIFFGDITYEESEISWIEQTDMSPLFTAYPHLTHFCVRGGNGLRLGIIDHESLKQLVVQAGGLDSDVVAQICKSKLPRLEHLELWLGDSNYGADCEVSHLMPILEGKLFPRLTYLGLRNSEITDDIAVALASAPIVQQLDCLDLSMGTISDRGGEALLHSSAIKKLKVLNLNHHYLSTDMMNRFSSLGPETDIGKQLTGQPDGDEVYRYVAVSE